MAKKINRSEYDIRTLSYYQSLGGVYNEIITILSQMRKDSGYRGLPSPAVILNEASYWWDVIEGIWADNGYKYIVPSELKNSLILSVVACLAADNTDCRSYLMGQLDDLYYYVQDIQKMLEGDKQYYPWFKVLIEEKLGLHKAGLESLQSSVHLEKVKELTCLLEERERELCEKNDLLERQNNIIAEQSSALDSLQNEYKSLQTQCAVAESHQYDGSNFDRLLTVDSILGWIESRHHYNYTEQVFRMLADLKCDVATAEERAKIKEVEDRMLDKNQVSAVFNQNFAVNSNMMTGMVSNPQLPIGVSPADLQTMFQQFLNQLNYGEG